MILVSSLILTYANRVNSSKVFTPTHLENVPSSAETTSTQASMSAMTGIFLITTDVVLDVKLNLDLNVEVGLLRHLTIALMCCLPFSKKAKSPLTSQSLLFSQSL